MNKFIRFLIVVVFSIVIFGCVGTPDWQKKDDEYWANIIKSQNEKASNLLSKGMYKEVATKQWVHLSDNNKIKTLSLMNDEYKPKDIITHFKAYIKHLKEMGTLSNKQVKQAKIDLSLSDEYTSSYIVNIMSTNPSSRSINSSLVSLIDNLKEQHSLLNDLLLNFSISQYQLYGIDTNTIFDTNPTNSDIDKAFVKADAGDVAELKLYGEQGYSMAQEGLGIIYGKGENHKEAVRWYKKAAKNGRIDAQVLLANRYTEDKRGLKTDWHKAFYWYEKAAEQQFTSNKTTLMTAQERLADLYCLGLGVDASYDNAYKWYEKAISQGSIDAEGSLDAIEAKCSIYSKPSLKTLNKIKIRKARINKEENLKVVKIKNTPNTYTVNKNHSPNEVKEATSNFLSDAWDNLNTQAGQNSWDTKLYRLGEVLSNMGTPYSQRGVAPSYRWMADEPDSGFNYSDYNRMSEQNKTDRKIKELEKKIEDSTFGYMSGNQMYSKSNKYMGYIKNSNLYNKHNQKTGYIRGNGIYSNSGKYLGYTR